MPLHAATKIVMWLILAIFTQWMHSLALLVLSVLMLLLVFYFKAYDFFRLIRRTRYLLVSLLLIYGFATPGDEIYPMAGSFSPSLQGLQLGSEQAWRLLLLLAGLALLSRTTSRDSLLSGLYILMMPLKLFGLNIEKIALRIWLTLHYAEQPALIEGRKSWRNIFEVTESLPTIKEDLILTVDRFNLRDLVGLLSLIVLVLGLLRL